MEAHATRAFGQQREHDVAAVVVGEPLAGGEHGRVPVQHRQVLLGRRQLVHRHRHHVVGDVADGVLVEVVADPGTVGQQVLDGDVVGDQGQVVAEQRAGGGVEPERPALDQGHDRQRGEALGCARGGEQRVDRVEDPVRPIGEPVGAASSVSPARSMRTTPENPVRSASASTMTWRGSIPANLASRPPGTPAVERARGPLVGAGAGLRSRRSSCARPGPASSARRPGGPGGPAPSRPTAAVVHLHDRGEHDRSGFDEHGGAEAEMALVDAEQHLVGLHETVSKTWRPPRSMPTVRTSTSRTPNRTPDPERRRRGRSRPPTPGGPGRRVGRDGDGVRVGPVDARQGAREQR